MLGAGEIVADSPLCESTLVSQVVDYNDDTECVDHHVLSTDIGTMPSERFTHSIELAYTYFSRLESSARYSVGERGVEDIDQMTWRDAADSMGCFSKEAVRVTVSW